MSLVTGQNYVLGIAVTVLSDGFGIGLVFAAPLGWLLGFLLRPVLNQWVHVAVFFAAPTLVFWTLGALLGFGWTIEALGFWATVASTAAIGRLAVRKYVDLVQVQPRGQRRPYPREERNSSALPGVRSDELTTIKQPGG